MENYTNVTEKDLRKESNIKQTLSYYKELNSDEKEQLFHIGMYKNTNLNAGLGIMKDILIIDKGLGQDITAQDLKDNINNRECTRNLLTRLFASYIEDAFLDIFIRKVKEDKDLTRFIKLHRERPLRTYKCLIGIIR